MKRLTHILPLKNTYKWKEEYYRYLIMRYQVLVMALQDSGSTYMEHKRLSISRHNGT